MKNSARAQDRHRRHGDCRSANEEWKSRWSAVRLWSAVAAVALHVAVLAAWPRAQSPIDMARVSSPVMQLVALADHQPPQAQEAAADAEPDRVDAPEQAPVIEEPELLATMKTPRPSLSASAAATMEAQHEFGVRTQLSFAPQRAVLTDYDMPNAGFTWPEIRNPRAMVSYLRSQYNAIHTLIVPDRFVSIALWIDELGAVERSEVRESSGDPRLDQIAMAALNEVVEFVPASRYGSPVPVAVVLSIPFQVPW